MELDTTARPLRTVQAALGPHEAVFRDALGLGYAQGREHAVREEHEPAAGPEEPSGFGHPTVGVAPHARAVLAHDEIERAAAERHPFAVGFDQREPRPALALATPGGLELRAGRVE